MHERSVATMTERAHFEPNERRANDAEAQPRSEGQEDPLTVGQATPLEAAADPDTGLPTGGESLR